MPVALDYSNGSRVETPSGASCGPLKIVIIGGGIGGLTAALALRQNGHDVVVLEQWDGSNETGAAIHLAPNSNGVLRRLGLYAETIGANPMLRHTEYATDGSQIRSLDLTESNKQWQHQWLLAHRIHLHAELQRLVKSRDGPGRPVDLRYSCTVKDLNCDTATAILDNDESVEGDVIIGADGVFSAARTKVKGGHLRPFSSGKSAFRFLVKKQDALDDPLTRKFAERDGELVMFLGPDSKIVAYPCKNNELLNFVCIHPSEKTSAPADDWNTGGSKKALLDVYADFDESARALLSKSDPASLKVWQLLDMETLPTWVNNKLALLGDAAHPFLPHQGQGGGQAIEDAAALAVVLPLGTQADEVAERLKLYETCRYERAHRIQEYTRQAGRCLGEDGKIDMMEYVNYNFGHDEFDSATGIFNKWCWAKNPDIYWRMPVSFGPSPGPRQALYTNEPQPARHSTFTTASIKFKTSRTFLQNLFPTESFQFKNPGTVAYASFSQTTLGKMEWLGGSGYRHFGMYIHGVRYTKQNGETVDGTYMPLLFESLTDPIVSGRDELGMPKVFCDVDIRRREDSYRVRTSWQGSMFGKFNLDELEEADPAAEAGTIGGEADYGILTYKYSPAVGERGKADAAYAVVVPHAEESKVVPSKVTGLWKCKKPNFKFDALTQQDLPTLHHIVSKLAQTPVYEFISGKVVEGYGVPDVSAARRIE
ncbi:FAD/NAD(P)-binding domain-containing protein [Aureobasidium pullulans]|nr:FAD/NAD(P)-binding domain-containing protein [Aureobasidium pullulans]